ncbi:MAG: MlaD family protein [Gammaproteobacteria bacterium]
MKQDHINYFAVGCFVLAMFVLLIATLFRISGKDTDSDTYYALYSNINGITRGSVVTYGGFQIGHVDDITPVRENDSTQFKLELGIQSGWKIPDNSIARIISPGMLSDSQIDISDGNSTTMLSPGGYITGSSGVSMMSVLSSIASQTEDLAESSIKPLLNNLNRHVDKIGNSLSADLPDITTDTKRLIADLQNSADRLNGLLSRKNQSSISNALTNTEQLTKTLVDMSSEFNTVVDHLDQLTSNANAVLESNNPDIRKSVIDIRKTTNALSGRIESIVYNLESASRNLSEFSHQIRVNPGVLLNGSPADDQVK